MKTLSKRELDVVRLLTEGKTNRVISQELYISVHTVKAILEKVYEKLSVHSRVQVAVIYAKQKIFDEMNE